jgi:hypothetical protein
VHQRTVQANGRVDLGPHTIRLGADYRGAQVTLLVNGPRVAFHALDGQLLGQVVLQPGKRYAKMDAA